MSEKISHRCFVCKEKVFDLHAFYQGLCVDCGDLNFSKRALQANLTGQLALVTGARIGIGFMVAKKLLRDGATIIATTRFPHDAAARFAREDDFDQWKDRLSIINLDLMETARIDDFARFLSENFDKLDILINNAAQTIRRPREYYCHLNEFEKQRFDQLPTYLQPLLEENIKFTNYSTKTDDGTTTEITSMLSAFAPALMTNTRENSEEDFPEGMLTEDNQQLDRREQNSWVATDQDVSSAELLEVLMVNVMAPFMLNSRLKPLMKRKDGSKSFIINVTSVEGQFSGANKSIRHPHTNMAKAAINMMTRTCAREYARESIFMNSVDPGWVSFQHPYSQKVRMQARGVKPPFDLIDAAARICDPIYDGINGNSEMVWGRLFKDYRATEW